MAGSTAGVIAQTTIYPMEVCDCVLLTKVHALGIQHHTLFSLLVKAFCLDKHEYLAVRSVTVVCLRLLTSQVVLAPCECTVHF